MKTRKFKMYKKNIPKQPFTINFLNKRSLTNGLVFTIDWQALALILKYHEQVYGYTIEGFSVTEDGINVWLT